ncbi:MAG TPA: GYD domain-containing protein [Micromonosporaceae bacterium]|jgi:uncharacterized protein with GYD domain
MPKYVSLINWTDKGIHDYTDSVARNAEGQALAKRLGGAITDSYWTVGEYDLVVVAEFPDDEAATAFLLAVGSETNVRTKTMRAFDASEFSDIVGKLN